MSEVSMMMIITISNTRTVGLFSTIVRWIEIYQIFSCVLEREQ